MEKSSNILSLPVKKHFPAILTEIDDENTRKNPIKIRYKPIGKRSPQSKIKKVEGYSLYLDIWKSGRHTYKFLKLYVYGTSKSKIQDQNTIKAAIEARDLIRGEMVKSDLGVEWGDKRKSDLFLPYFKDHILDNVWESAYHHLELFLNTNIKFSHIDEDLCEAFYNNHLLKKVNTRTANLYYSKLVRCLNLAKKDKKIKVNPAIDIERKKAGDTDKEFLSTEELQTAINTPAKYTHVKHAFIFSCYTGMRLSDLQALTFDQIRDGQVHFKQVKTKGSERLPLHPIALKIIEKQKKLGTTDKMFNLPVRGSYNQYLKDWMEKAGIKRKITSHCGRHTFAVMSLEAGVDIYTLSKLLGHRDIATTEVYAKIVDKTKDKAISNLPNLDF